jgi:hypothetical protein
LLVLVLAAAHRHPSPSENATPSMTILSAPVDASSRVLDDHIPVTGTPGAASTLAHPFANEMRPERSAAGLPLSCPNRRSVTPLETCGTPRDPQAHTRTATAATIPDRTLGPMKSISQRW